MTGVARRLLAEGFAPDLRRCDREVLEQALEQLDLEDALAAGTGDQLPLTRSRWAVDAVAEQVRARARRHRSRARRSHRRQWIAARLRAGARGASAAGCRGCRTRPPPARAPRARTIARCRATRCSGCRPASAARVSKRGTRPEKTRTMSRSAARWWVGHGAEREDAGRPGDDQSHAPARLRRRSRAVGRARRRRRQRSRGRARSPSAARAARSGGRRSGSDRTVSAIPGRNASDHRDPARLGIERPDESDRQADEQQRAADDADDERVCACWGTGPTSGPSGRWSARRSPAARKRDQRRPRPRTRRARRARRRGPAS